MSSIRSRDVACTQRPYIRCLEHLLQLLDFVNDAFYVHPSQYPTWEQQSSNRAHICGMTPAFQGDLTPEGALGFHGGQVIWGFDLFGHDKVRGIPQALKRGTHTTNIALCGPPSDFAFYGHPRGWIFKRHEGGPFKPDFGLSGAVPSLNWLRGTN
jgi:hypothetical protein